MDEKNARTQLIEVCRLAYDRRYICGTEGNFSIRLDENILLTTPKGACKGRLSEEELVLTNIEGKAIPGDIGRYGSRQPSTELPMHLTAYQARPDIKAVVHAHPTTAVGFTVAGMPLMPCILPEVVCTIGTVPTAAYATPSTEEVSNSIVELVKTFDVVMMDHHGALCLGNDIWDAFYKLETLEHHAETMLIAHMLGGAKPLSVSQVKQLLAIRSVYGQTRPLPAELLISAECARQEN